MARVVVPDVPHHITQRGNRRLQTFFSDNDYRQYINIMRQSCTQHSVEIWAYCLMPNHVHLIAVPSRSDSLRFAIGEAHRQYTRMINFSHEWRGHLWQERFFSFPMDELHLLAAARYIELNPVRAGLVTRPADYKWSSARAHIRGEDDNLIKVEPLIALVPDWHSFLKLDVQDKDGQRLRLHERTGRPLGSSQFVDYVEKVIDRVVRKQKPGPKGKH